MISNFVAKFCPNCKSEMVGIVKVSSNESEIACEDCDFVCIVRPSKAEREVATATDSQGGSMSETKEQYEARMLWPDLTLRGKATDHIWCMEDVEGYIGIRMDSGDSGTVYLTKSQAADLAEQLRAVAGNASAPVGERVRDTESFTRGRHWELAEYENHLRSHNPQIGGVCSWCKLETQWGRVVQPQPSGVGEPRQALCEALDCIGENIDIAGTEWADRPMKQWMSDWRAVLSTPSPTEGASSPADARSELVQKEVGEGLREAADRTIVQKSGDLYDSVDANLRQMRHYAILQADIAENWKKRAEKAEAALAAPAPRPFANQFIVTKSIAEDGHTIKYFDPAGKQIFISDAPAPKPAPPAEPLTEALTHIQDILVTHPNADGARSAVKVAREAIVEWERRAAERKPPR